MADQSNPISPAAQIGTGMAIAGGQSILDQIFLERNVKAQQRIGKFNQQLALDTWEKTNYPAQRRQMEKAGLNVGLLYKGAGEGGQILGGQAQGTEMPAPNIGMGIQVATQIQNTRAQTELAQAQARNLDADTKKKAGPDTDKIYTEMEKIANESNNIVLKNEAQRLQNELLDIEARIKGSTIEDAISLINNQADKAEGEAMSALTKGNVDQSLIDDFKTAFRLQVQSTRAAIALQKQGLIKGDAEISNIKEATSKIKSEIALNYQQKFINWEKLNLQERETIVKEILAKTQSEQVQFDTSTPQKIRQWIGIFTDLAGGAKDVTQGARNMKK